MVQITMRIENIDELRRRFANADDIILGELSRVALDSVNVGVPVVQEETPRGARGMGPGGLARSTQGSRPVRTEAGYMAAILQRARTPEGIPYGRFVRGGTRPHFLPRGAIEGPLTDWAQRKFGLTRVQATRRAYAVARTIGRRGTRANPYHIRARDRLMPTFQRILAEANGRIARLLMRGRN
jgi:hypothetical protein